MITATDAQSHGPHTGSLSGLLFSHADDGIVRVVFRR